MAAEQEHHLLQLFDLHWFKRQILTNPSPFHLNPPNPDPIHRSPSFKPTRSFSDRSLSSKVLINGDGANSPNSVLAISALLAGEESDESPKIKSTSELEFEEIKGFMDLGFFFTEESLELVSILPGLQRLKGMKSSEDEGQMRGFSRPYLSEAWEEMEMNRRRRKEEDKVALRKMKKKWRVPAVRSEADMKQHLRMWAQAVASAVR